MANPNLIMDITEGEILLRHHHNSTRGCGPYFVIIPSFTGSFAAYPEECGHVVNSSAIADLRIMIWNFRLFFWWLLFEF